MGQKYAAYTPSTGAIIGFYDSVDSPPPATASVLAITTAQWQTCLVTAGYTVTGGVLTAPSSAALLAQAQSAAVARLTAACAATITAGYPSSALGAVYGYPMGQTDQDNLIAATTASLNAATVWTTPFWCADSGGNWAMRPHTASQIQTVQRDSRAWVVSNQTRLAARVAAVNAAATVAGAGAVVW